MADAADEPTLKEFPEFPGEPMSKRCGATRAKDATTTADGAMAGSDAESAARISRAPPEPRR